jgi:hypothetical protein
MMAKKIGKKVKKLTQKAGPARPRPAANIQPVHGGGKD